MRSRPLWPCVVLLLTGALCLLAGGVALYGQRAVLDENAFAGRAESALSRDEVRAEVADRIADRLVLAHPELAARRPVLDAATNDMVATPGFAGEFRRGAIAMQRALFESSSAPVELPVPGGGHDLAEMVRNHSPAAVRGLPATDPKLMTIGGGRLETGLRDAAPIARRLAGLALPALLAGAVLLVLAVLRAPTRRRGLRRAALAVAGVGGVIIAGLAIARGLLLATFDTSHGDAVVGEIWHAYLGDLRLWGFACGALGLIVAAAADPGAPGAWRRAVAFVARTPHPAWQAVRIAGLLLVAVLLLTAPEVPVDLGLVALAGLLVFTAAAEVSRLRLARPPADH